MSTVVFLHADPFLPRCQETLVRRALERTFAAGAYRVVATATLAPPPAWSVPAWVARSMLAKLETLRARAAGALYLDARLIIASDLQGLIDSLTPVADALPLRAARLLWVPPGHHQLGPVEADRGYDAVADQEVRGLELAPESWRPTSFGADPAAHVVDATARGDRPWTSPFAPAGTLWLRGLRDVLAAGAVTREELTTDQRAGLLRPSLLPQLDLGREDARRLPAELLAQDASFPFAETSPSPGQRELLASREFAQRMLELRRLNRRLVKGSQRAPATGARTAAHLLKLPGRLLRRALGDGEAP